MKFQLDEQARDVREHMTRFGDRRLADLGAHGAHDLVAWKELVDFGMLHGSIDGMRDIDVAVGMIAAARGGLPGPLLEAELAGATGNQRAIDLLRDGRIVTSVPPGPASSVIAGWGAVADLVVDQGSGDVIADGPADPVKTALPMMHGMVERPGSDADPLLARRWLLGAALLVGLGQGALRLATEHVKVREQFGRPLASFQAVQFRLAESVVKLDAAEMMVIDAARRSDAGDEGAHVCAALAWAYASPALEIVEKHVHQVFGALGFTQELGLIRLTYQSAWLRTSVGRDSALEAVRAKRSLADPVPSSVILGGFGAIA
jgi:hypothetical protein